MPNKPEPRKTFSEAITRVVPAKEQEEILGKEEEEVEELRAEDIEIIEEDEEERKREEQEAERLAEGSMKLTGELYHVILDEAETPEKRQETVWELNVLSELKEAKPCEPPCEPKSELGDDHKGINQSYILRLGREGKRVGVYKPAAGEASVEKFGWDSEQGLRAGIRRGSYFKREWLTFMVDRAFDLDLAPPTVLRRKDHGIGSLQEWVTGEEGEKLVTAEEAPERKPQVQDLVKLALLDYLTGQQDRKETNWLISKKGRLYAIDNGVSFAPEMKIGNLSVPALEILSKPLEQVEKISRAKQGEIIKEKIDKFLESEQRQKVLKQAFEFALGDDAESVWQTFWGRIQKLGKEQEPSLPGHSWDEVWMSGRLGRAMMLERQILREKRKEEKDKMAA